MTSENQIVVAVKAVILHEGKVLIVKRATDDDVGGGTWECPGGKLEFGENLEDALVREIEEEVGLQAAVDKILYAAAFKTNPSRQVVLLTYLCRADDHKVVLSKEHTDFKWAAKEGLKHLLPEAIINDFERNKVCSIKEIQ